MNAAQRLAAYGRRGDNNLVHVSDKELRGIEQLTGRKFTQNPVTGLPEAFNFADLLPVAAGIGATLLTGGAAAPLAGAAAAGVTRAGVSAAQGKEAGAALMDGVLAGATSYATAGLMQGAGELGAASVNATPSAMADAGSFGLSAPQAEAAQAAAGVGGSPSAATQAYQAADASGRLGMIGQGIQNNPTGALGQLASRQGLVAAGGTYAQLSGMMSPVGQPGSGAESYNAPEAFPAPRSVRMPGPGYRPGSDPEFRYFAEGGLAELPTRNLPHYNDAQNVVAEARAAMLGEHPARNDAVRRLDEQMGPDTVRAVEEEGGRVRGAGGGLDDLVPGTIEGRQQVRLADGEFVIPADVVSALGDGSTDQGARKLHEMMNRVRKAKTGSTQQPGRVSDEVFPA